ncbi:hypothetical protein Q2T42_01880 [Leptolyngbya boryana CZ1]|uniref:Uncharacterized protein n=1 Tax=Leptolyngbya boryana CZ1 TaxID=3060204 RepID=A0AA97ARH1_LEPBY|nr:DUF6658 family protein [Leptolyngbya boryana]WNZ46584.1 hypothetical protein Q2T42_01880 [Leptolyngbya boryana CZ1]
MSKIASVVKALRLKEITIAFLAGVMLLLNTACSGAAQAKMPSLSTSTSLDNDPHPVNQTQPYKGGMNNYDDTPPGQIPSEKAKSLVDNAKRNVDARYGNALEKTSDELGDTMGERVNRVTETAKNAVGRGTQNIKDNVKDAAGDAAYQSKRTTKTLSDKAQDAIDAAKDTVK